jgi:Uma2 family endonuclease
MMSDMAIDYARHRITVDEYHRMDEAGVFPPDARIELIEGELVETLVTMKPPHASVVGSLTEMLVIALAGRALLRCQLPVTIGDASEPQPDFTIVRGPRSAYRTRHPGPDEVYCAIEVAESSRNFDVRRKAPLYAAYGIPETWVVDLVDGCVRVLREPRAWHYASASVATPGDVISLLAFPDIEVHVATLLGLQD